MFVKQLELSIISHQLANIGPNFLELYFLSLILPNILRTSCFFKSSYFPKDCIYFKYRRASETTSSTITFTHEAFTHNGGHEDDPLCQPNPLAPIFALNPARMILHTSRPTLTTLRDIWKTTRIFMSLWVFASCQWAQREISQTEAGWRRGVEPVPWKLFNGSTI